MQVADWVEALVLACGSSALESTCWADDLEKVHADNWCHQPTTTGDEHMQSDLIIDALLLVAVLEADLGAHRKIGRFRILRPLLLAGAIIPIYLKAVATTGTGFTLELALGAAGVVFGLVAVALTTVYRSPRTNQPVSRAKAGYAALWVGVIGARAAFSYGSTHWFAPQISHWMTRNAVSSAAITDALIFMAVTMMVTRTLGLLFRTLRLGNSTQSVGGTSHGVAVPEIAL
jgi:hypothetical protein